MKGRGPPCRYRDSSRGRLSPSNASTSTLPWSYKGNADCWPLRYRRTQTMREPRMATKTAMKLLQCEMESGMPSEGEQGYLNGYQRDRNQSRTRGNRVASPALSVATTSLYRVMLRHRENEASIAEVGDGYKPTLLERIKILRPGAFNSFATTIQMAPLATPFIGIASDHMWSHVCRSSSRYPTVR